MKIIHVPDMCGEGRMVLIAHRARKLVATTKGYCVVAVAVSMLIASLLYSNAAHELRIYYVPLAEEQVRSLIGNLEAPEQASESVHTFITVMPSGGEVIYYDHWEDGYEVDIEHPAQTTTEIWGDGDPENGSVPGQADDVIVAGAMITIETIVFANPRDPSQVLYDGHDKLASAQALEITRSAGDDRLGFLVEAMEVSNRLEGNTRYEISPSVRNAMKYTSFAVIASADNTTVEIDKGGDGSIDEIKLLDKGAQYNVEGGIEEGAIVSASHPVQMCLYRSGQTS